MKKNQLILILVLILLIISINYYTFKKKGIKEPIELPPELITSDQYPSNNFSKINYVGSTPIFSTTKLPLLKVSVKENETLYSSLKKYCQIYNQEDIYYDGEICDFTAYLNNQRPQVLTRSQTYSSNKISNSQLLELGYQYLKNFYSTTNADFFHTKINYFSGEQEFVPSSINDANLARIDYNYGYQQIPIFHKNDDSSHTDLLINNNNQVVMANLNIKQIDIFPEKDNYQLLDITNALKNIEQQKAYLLSFSEMQDYLSENYSPVEDFNLNLFTSVNLNSVKLEYRYGDDNFAVPVYRFSGTAIDLNQNELFIEIITPAINFTVSP